MDAPHAHLCLLAHSLPDLRDSLLRSLLLRFGSISALWAAKPGEWRRAGAPATTVGAVRERQQAGLDAARYCSPGALAEIERDDTRVLVLGEPGYPPLLAQIHDPPPLLYVRGQAPCLRDPQLAVVGSRRPSPAGKRAAAQFAAAAAVHGLTVTSGLALGIDGEAHRAALAAGGTTIAVMATGIDRVYPARHRALAAEVSAAGCLLTELRPGSDPLPWHFPRRNRIISGLALGTLVAEAAERSGSLITAGTALEQGREVFAVPHSLFHPGGRGCLQLLADGAPLVRDIADILAGLGMLFELQRGLDPPPRAPPAPDDSGGERVLAVLGYEPVTVDALVTACGLPTARVLAALSVLELNGQAVRRGGNWIRA
jgi:DNA processing protein